MPPSPRISATVDEGHYADACDLLGLTHIHVPTYSIHRSTRPGRPAFGDYSLTDNHIRLFLGVSNYEYDNLRFAQTELARTLLHELRHAYQHFNSKPLSEADAEGWAVSHVAHFKNIVRLTRSFPNSGFSRLGRHDRRRVV